MALMKCLLYHHGFSKNIHKGIDAIYRFPVAGINTYIIAESKGGTSKLSKGAKKGDQMYDKWINNSIETLTRGSGELEKRNLFQANNANIPMLAVVVKLNLGKTKPEIDFGIQFYRGITSWGTPFE